MSHDLDTRVALLEHIAKTTDEDVKTSLEAIAKHMEDEDVKWDTIQSELHNLKITVVKYKSFLGGVVFTTSALWGIFFGIAKYMGWFANGN